MTIRGWTPLQSDGDDDQGVSSDTQSCQMITFNARNPEQSVHSYKSACSPESSSSSVSGVFEATPESPRPRKGDPGWVARPRNAFFIFRCNFIQDHSRGGRKATVASPSTAEKTLSKRAGEAWRSLTPEEKARYSRLADEEKIQHAQKHPGYRYRPPLRRTIHSRSPPPQAEGAFRSPILLSPEPKEQSSLTCSRRRSISVPPFSLLHTAFSPPQSMPGPGIRRAASYQEPGISVEPSSSLSSFVSNQLVYPDGTSAPTEHEPSPMSGHTSPAQSVDCHGYNMSPLTAVTSSLANGNGEVDYIALHEPPATSLGTQMWSSPEPFMGEASSGGSSQLRSPATLPMVYVPITPLYPPGGVGIVHELPHFASQLYCVQDTPMTNYTLDEAARARALHVYHAGLSERANTQYLEFDMPVSEEQRLFNGLNTYDS
uniref:HMG box domain-containing protein n=2 Tax=Moniliophthora roreri TaxID=221103 RepID=A0A0W0F876_MONRR